MANLQQFCTFFLKDQFFGVPVQQVQEVIRYQEMTRVPLTPQVIRGLINLRGQIVMAVDLRRRFAMEDRPASQLPMNVVVRTDDGAVSFLVDEIGAVAGTGHGAGGVRSRGCRPNRELARHGLEPIFIGIRQCSRSHGKADIDFTKEHSNGTPEPESSRPRSHRTPTLFETDL